MEGLCTDTEFFGGLTVLEIQRLLVCVAIKAVFFFLWLRNVLMVLEKYLKAVFSTEPLIHLDTHLLQVILLESAKPSQGPAEPWKVLKPHHTHHSMQRRCHPFFFFCLLKILQKTHYHIWGNTFSKSPFNLLTEELLLHCHLPAHLALITCLSTWTIVFKVLFLQMHKITKLDPSLILPFYSWFQMSNVRGSFLAKSRVFYIISVQIPKSQYWKLKELQDLSSWDRRSQNPDSPLPPYSSSETETQS